MTGDSAALGIWNGLRDSDAPHEVGESAVGPQRVVPLVRLQQNQHTLSLVVSPLKVLYRLVDLTETRMDPGLV